MIAKKHDDIEASPIYSQECLNHKKPFIYLCLTHNLNICSFCKDESHKSCKIKNFENEFNMLFQNFEYDLKMTEWKSFFDNGVDILQRLNVLIVSLQSEFYTLKNKSAQDFLKNSSLSTKYQKFCQDNNLMKASLIEGIYLKYIELFKDKHNDVYKKIQILEKEIKIVESNYARINRINKSNREKPYMQLYNLMREIDISSQKNELISKNRFLLKNEPLDKIPCFEKIQEIIKEQISELITEK